MLVNNIFDYVGDWYMTTDTLNSYCEQKYGDSVDAIAYYADEYGNVLYPGSTTLKNFLMNSSNIKYQGNVVEITNRQHEMLLNEKRKIIRYIIPDYMPQFINKFTSQVTGQ
jgi:hypothetical protein